MAKNRRDITKEFGDFQTPSVLALEIAEFLKSNDFYPKSVIEPTCGTGSFVIACKQVFPSLRIYGFDINGDHINHLKKYLDRNNLRDNVFISKEDFFVFNWKKLIKNVEKPILFIGNPPWVTSSELGMLESKNVPNKSNFQNLKGIDALTGKSNFDISEWMILELINYLKKSCGAIAMICKVTVARKVIEYSKKNNIPLTKSYIHMIDSKKYFDVSVDACLFIIIFRSNLNSSLVEVFGDISFNHKISELDYIDNMLLANSTYYKKWKHLMHTNNSNKIKRYIWRSGIKHDASKIMELKKTEENRLINGFNEEIILENNLIFPLLKSSDIANYKPNTIRKYVIVTQQKIGEQTSYICNAYPQTWEYLEKHKDKLNARKSSIYREKPKYSIFGVGDYSFSPWKIAISGFYKKIKFALLEPVENKPIMLDDTCYFLSFNNYAEAIIIYSCLRHSTTQEFYKSFIFWDMKRPITKQVLQKLNIHSLIKEVGKDYILDFVTNNEYNVKYEDLLIAYENLNSKI